MDQVKETGNWYSGRQNFKYCRNGFGDVIWRELSIFGNRENKETDINYSIRKNQVQYSEYLFISIIYCYYYLHKNDSKNEWLKTIIILLYIIIL